MSITSTRGTAVSAEKGNAFWMLGVLFTVKASKASTGGALSILEFHQPRGTEPPLHTHDNEDEAFFVLDGQMGITCGDDSFELAPGGFAWLPRGVLHGFTVLSDTIRGLVLTSPGGFDEFVAEMGEPARTRTIPQATPPDLARLVALTEKYGIHLQLRGA